jgi:hypothetical protein
MGLYKLAGIVRGSVESSLGLGAWGRKRELHTEIGVGTAGRVGNTCAWHPNLMFRVHHTFFLDLTGLSRNWTFEMLERSPHRLDLSPSDCQFLYPLQNTLKGRYCTSDQQVTEAVHTWLISQDNFFFWRHFLSPLFIPPVRLWDYQYMYDIVDITLWV